MTIELNKEYKIEFKQYFESSWFGNLLINEIDHEFTFDDAGDINWLEIKNRLLYFINHHNEIIEMTNNGIKNYLNTSLGWKQIEAYDLECVIIPLNSDREDDFIIHPIFILDPYVQWYIYIYDNEGPRLRKVTRE
ncbi:hypothetical protein [Flavobacterium phragmitis]|uniref:Uncharacterized protein n=1 Tax=Flavobacterium phragmitis TaxID=739143 RepID=A0A1I1Q5Z0_9FLAO|nr:hypothetical protein [Flavobacterium phragmitis]SFD17534.1 hypothetical protein SAMN05216297_105107 [Flavobacterium phragmitis]